MTPIESDILKALVELERMVERMPSASPKPDLLPLFGQIDELTRQLPRQTDPSLLHYLHKRSYAKARLFLEGREQENASGSCRHVD